ncbi:MAG: hypothetical protein B6D62_00030 [Candidatus Cloacimonas sp. 4484_275]|nr:MAG: hypothetical protein B6D62_00030 [Candidatus Cloacimonas sp. 4484_275]
MKKLKVIVEKIIDHCDARLKQGDTFYVTGKGKIVIPGNKAFRMFALQSLIPFLASKQRDYELKDKDYLKEMKKLCCPDSGGAIFRIEEK